MGMTRKRFSQVAILFFPAKNKIKIIIMDKLLHKIKRLIPQKIFKFFQPGYHYIMAWLAAVWYQFPSEEIIVIGVTGTTGKTTSVYLIAKSLEAAGYKAGYSSTAMFNDGEKEWLNDKKMTMPGRFFTQHLLRNMANNGCHYAIIETTSEGVAQFRHRFINYDILVFTGLYEEHLEAHGSFAGYKQAKLKLFRHLKNCKIKYANDNKKVCLAEASLKKIDYGRVKKTIIANGDDQHAGDFLAFWAEQKLVYAGLDRVSEAVKIPSGATNIGYRIISHDHSGIAFRFEIRRQGEMPAAGTVRLKLLGLFSATNALNALALGVSQDICMADIVKGLESVTGIPGRMEKIDEGQPFTVIVDYAFEPNALEKLYETIKLIPHRRIIHVLGSAGGGRDAARRPKLGAIAGRIAGTVIVTNEDPYDENPALIIDQVAAGAKNAGKKLDKDLYKIPDRYEAIRTALSLAKPEDIVLITGKGSEQAICSANGEKITWDDRAVARGILNENK